MGRGKVMRNIGLICTVHDPKGKQVKNVEGLYEKIKDIYRDFYITLSEETSSDLYRKLKENNFNIRVIPKMGAAHARRQVLRFGLEGDNEYFHYCDFDRFLTWANEHLDELDSVAGEVVNKDYLVIGRSEKAFNSHPKEWKETEMITNKIFSLELGIDADVTAGSCGFSRKCGELILKNSKEKMTDAEWPMIAYRMGNMNVGYKAYDGLKFVDEINGYDKIKEEANELFARLRLAYIISETAMSTGKK